VIVAVKVGVTVAVGDVVDDTARIVKLGVMVPAFGLGVVAVGEDV
jgi:hypothetical protein